MDVRHLCAWGFTDDGKEVCVCPQQDMSFDGLHSCAITLGLTWQGEQRHLPADGATIVRGLRIESVVNGHRYALWSANEVFDSDRVWHKLIGSFRVIRTRGASSSKDDNDDTNWTTAIPELETELDAAGLSTCIALSKKLCVSDTVVLERIEFGSRTVLVIVDKGRPHNVPPFIELWNTHWQSQRFIS